MDAAIATHLLQHAPDALLLADAQGKIVFTNKATSGLFGYSEAQLLNQPIEMLLPQRYRGRHIRHREEFAKQPAHRAMGQRGVPLYGRRHDGSEFPIWVSLSPMEIDGELRIAAAIRDVTDWEELTQHLREASEMAKQASQTKSRFLATASHDLRQPLQALQLLTASLERKLAGHDAKVLVERQQHAIDTMTELLNALLDISKLESGKVEIKLEPIDVQQLIGEVREQFESVITTKSLTLDVQPAAIQLLTDRILIRQLLHNLIGNAIKYTERGGISVKLLPSAAEMLLEVTDSGIGIPRDQLAKIFDAYYQPHSARPDRPGVGLGLAIVKQITELLGYGITVESQPGRGTCFRVSIPNVYVSDMTHSVAMPSAAIGNATAAAGLCILVIEDDHAVREALCLALQLEGFETLSASNTYSAHQVFAEQQQRISAIISDFHVDEQHTGVDIVKSLRRQVPQRTVPAVFLTGDTSLAVRSQQDLPASRLLNKPVDINQLMQALGDLLT